MNLRRITKSTLLIALPLLLRANAPALPPALEPCWDESYRLGDEENPHALLQSMNGWIVVVGEAERPGRGKDGFMLIVDPATGRILFNRPYGGEKDDVLLDARQANDGTYYLAGYTSSKGNGRSDAWLLHVDERGEVIGEQTFGSRDEERFTHLAILKNGTLLLAGLQGKKPDGNIWVSTVEGMAMTNEQLIGNGMYENVAGAYRSSEGTVWLSGNITYSKTKEHGHAWAVELDERGNVIRGSTKRIDAPDYGELNHMEGSILGDMVLAGTCLKSGQRDAWMVEIDDHGNELFNLPYGDRQEEYGLALLKTIQDHYLLARQIAPSGYGPARSQIALVDDKGGEAIYDIPQEDPFFINRILYAFDRKFIAAGFTRVGREQHLRLVCLRPEILLAVAKGEAGPVVSCDNLRLDDENGDGILGNGERGAILFEITNTGETDILDGNIVLKGMPHLAPYDKVFVSYLPRGGKREVSVPVRGSDFRNPSISLSVNVYEKSQLIASFPFEIRASTAPSAAGPGKALEILTKWRTGYSNSNDHNNISARVGEDQITIRYEATSPYELKEMDFKARHNGVVVEYSKQGNRRFEMKRTEYRDYPFLYTLEFEARLDTGYNEFVIEIWRAGIVVAQDTLIFEYKPNHPNLHVLSIGPAGVGLEFNTKDALDFAGLMKAQEGKGYFNQVFIDTLASPESATAKSIAMAFANLTRRYHSNTSPRKIAPNDVLVIFISSHGLMVDDYGNQRFRIMPSDYDADFPLVTTVDYETSILRPLKAIDCKKLIFIDACHSGAAGVKDAKPAINRYLSELNATTPGLLYIASSSEEEFSYENEQWENGAFTKAIREAFSGETATGPAGEAISPQITNLDGLNLLSIEDLYDFLIVRVPNLVKSISSKLEQNPFLQSDNQGLKNIRFLTVPD
ncbi:MAG: caspase family protein [Lewinellaceae bacterium]|nr:caspase family protein [Lewinellaceae bacterium]